MMLRCSYLSVSVIFLLVLTTPLRANDATIQKFLNQHCVHCHGNDLQEGGLTLQSLPVSKTHLSQWTRIVEMVEHREMPPKEETRPDRAVVKDFITQVARQLAEEQSRPLGLRRLNRREYENSVHDLLGIDVPLLDLLPEDGSIQGFDKVGDGLSISSVLMEQYLEAANTAFDAVIRRIPPLPVETRRAVMMEVKENKDSVAKKKGGVIEAEASFVKFTPGWPPARIDPAHPIESGMYRCRVAVWPYQPGERTLAVAIYVGTLFGPDTRQFIGNFDVTGTAEEPRIIEFNARMNEGDAIHIVPRVWPEHITWRDKHEARPGIGIVWAETHGPLDQSFPSEATKQLFGDSKTISMAEKWPIWMRHRKGVKSHDVESSQPAVDAERIIREFIPKAFRRPVSSEESEPFVQLTLAKLEAGRTFEQAVRSGVTAILCAPQFLLLNKESRVDDYSLASRLSYFLWSTIPDKELLDLAAEGKLTDSEVRTQQLKRMLADPRSEEFVQDFIGQWLSLRDIDFTTPDQKLYPEFDPLLQAAMLGESEHFFRHILDENLSVLNFVDADWTFLNQRLATHYGLPQVTGHEAFRKVLLPEDSVRGSVLTQASVLKVTANGTTTSPVIRGVWVLDHLLARPSPPPPPGVPAVEPDIRGAKTIREQLAQHSEVGDCARCHRQIDPPGFALEQFDAIGGLRTFYRSIGEGEKIAGNKNYRQGPDVDPASELASGEEFANFSEYQKLLLADGGELFAQAFATKLTVYATGRPVQLSDRPVIDQIVQQSGADQWGMKSMLKAIINSELFLAP